MNHESLAQLSDKDYVQGRGKRDYFDLTLSKKLCRWIFFFLVWKLWASGGKISGLMMQVGKYPWCTENPGTVLTVFSIAVSQWQLLHWAYARAHSRQAHSVCRGGLLLSRKNEDKKKNRGILLYVTSGPSTFLAQETQSMISERTSFLRTKVPNMQACVSPDEVYLFKAATFYISNERIWGGGAVHMLFIWMGSSRDVKLRPWVWKFPFQLTL